MKSLGWIKIFALFALGFFPLLFIIFLNLFFDFALHLCLTIDDCHPLPLSCQIYTSFTLYLLILTTEALILLVFEVLTKKFRLKKPKFGFFWYLIFPVILLIILKIITYMISLQEAPKFCI